MLRPAHAHPRATAQQPAKADGEPITNYELRNPTLKGGEIGEGCSYKK